MLAQRDIPEPAIRCYEAVMKIAQDSDVYEACERAFIDAMARSIKVCIEHSAIGSQGERGALFRRLLLVVSERISGHAGGGALDGVTAYPAMGYVSGDAGDAIHFGNGSRLHKLAPSISDTLLHFSPKEFSIDGSRFSDLDGFYDEIGEVLIPGAPWGRNLDAFNDILRGGFGTPEEGFVLRWKHSAASRAALGYPETIKRLEVRLQRCHPSNRADVARRLAEAKAGRGQTVFDWLVEIVGEHCAGGREAGSNVRLVLE